MEKHLDERDADDEIRMFKTILDESDRPVHLYIDYIARSRCRSLLSLYIAIYIYKQRTT